MVGQQALGGVDSLFFDRDTGSTRLAQRLQQTYGEEDGEVRFPTDEWQALALIADIRRSEG
mgnify:CR=1 FL=1